MSQKGKAGRDLIQVGRDYITYIQTNIDDKNWGVVLLNFFILSLLGYGLFIGGRDVATHVTEFGQRAFALNPNKPSIPAPTASLSSTPNHSPNPSMPPTPTTPSLRSPSPEAPSANINAIRFPQESCGEESTDEGQSWYPVFIKSTDLKTVQQKYCNDAILVSRQTGEKSIQVASFTSYDKAVAFADTLGGEVGSPINPSPSPVTVLPTVLPVLPSPSTPPDLSPSSPPVLLPENPPKPDPNKCVVTITNSLVALKADPETFSREIIGVPSGDYTVLDYKVVNFGGLTNDGWFQIEVSGRTGWIVDNTWTINAKTQVCP
jgi:hypothetical protein